MKQQYFFCAATIRDLIKRFKSKHTNWNDFPKKNAIQLNDTHPTIAIVELLRVLIDEEKLPWEQTWHIIYNTFAFTNHTVLPEALEKWSVELIGRLLPRHLDLIYLVNFFFMQAVEKKYHGDYDKMSRMSLIEETYPKKVRMANLCIVASHAVNGVAQIHSDLLKATIFRDFNEFYPGKI